MIPDRRIFSCRHAFCGRDRDLERIVDAAFQSRSLAVTGPAGIGRSELLRQAFDELFYSENKLPVYFEFRSGEPPVTAARRFAREMLAQAVAFRRRDPDIIRVSPPLDEITRLSSPDDLWVDQSVEALRAAIVPEVVPTAFSLPARLAAAGLEVCVLLDDVHLAGGECRRTLESQVSLGHVSFVLCGDGEFPHLPLLRLKSIETARAAEIVASIAAGLGVRLSGSSRDLIAVQLEGVPADIHDLLLDAADDGSGAEDFRSVERLYVRSLLDGRLSTGDRGARVISDRKDIIQRLSGKNASRAAVTADMVCRYLSRAPKIMRSYYRSRLSLGMRELLKRFAGQSVPTAAVAYRAFKESYRGLDPDTAVEALAASTDRVSLPRIAYAAPAVDLYPPLAEFSDRDRSAVGLTETGEAWAMAEIDSKLEAGVDKTEFWCDRLEMATAAAGYDNVRIWLIAPEGFDEDALTLLGERGAFGSSRRQIGLLESLLDDPPEEHSAKYEISLPMGDEGELSASRTLDDIAQRHGIPSKTATRIKSALNEALINAAEHSLSPDRRILLQFAVTEAEMVVTVRNRGVRLIELPPADREVNPSERRGWGFSLMRKMMDEVTLGATDDGTCLIMTKSLR